MVYILVDVAYFVFNGLESWFELLKIFFSLKIDYFMYFLNFDWLNLVQFDLIQFWFESQFDRWPGSKPGSSF